MPHELHVVSIVDSVLSSHTLVWRKQVCRTHGEAPRWSRTHGERKQHLPGEIQEPGEERICHQHQVRLAIIWLHECACKSMFISVTDGCGVLACQGRPFACKARLSSCINHRASQCSGSWNLHTVRFITSTWSVTYLHATWYVWFRLHLHTNLHFIDACFTPEPEVVCNLYIVFLILWARRLESFYLNLQVQKQCEAH